jgi:hypothetical protein
VHTFNGSASFIDDNKDLNFIVDEEVYPQVLYGKSYTFPHNGEEVKYYDGS